MLEAEDKPTTDEVRKLCYHISQGVFHALRPEDLWCLVSFPVSVAV